MPARRKRWLGDRVEGAELSRRTCVLENELVELAGGFIGHLSEAKNHEG